MLDNEQFISPGVTGGKVPTKMFFCPSELNRIGDVAGRGGNSLQNVLDDAYDNVEPLETHAKSGSSHASGSYIFMMTTTQPETIRSSFITGATARGTVNRILPWYGTAKTEEAFDEADFDDAEFQRLLGELIAWTAFPPLVEWTPDSKEMFKEFFEETIRPAKEERKATESFLTRVKITLKKIVLLFALNAKHTQIEQGDVQIAKKMWPYLIYCWDRAMDNLMTTDMKELSDRVLAWIVNFKNKKKIDPTRRDIRRGIPGNYNNEVLKKALDFLEHFDLIELVPQPAGAKGGKPTERYKVNET
jgi:hypothetical protein